MIHCITTVTKNGCCELCSKSCSKFLGMISGISTIDRSRAFSGFSERLQVRIRLRLYTCQDATQARVGCFATASRWWIVSVTGDNTNASQYNRREGGFRASAFCKACARSDAKPIPNPARPGERPLRIQQMAGVRAPLRPSFAHSCLPASFCKRPELDAFRSLETQSSILPMFA